MTIRDHLREMFLLFFSRVGGLFSCVLGFYTFGCEESFSFGMPKGKKTKSDRSGLRDSFRTDLAPLLAMVQDWKPIT